MPKLLAALTLALTLALLAACSGTGTSGDDAGDDTDFGDTTAGGDCTTVDVAVSSEKISLLTELASAFNNSPAASVNGQCAVVRPKVKASGAAAQLLVDDWPDPSVNGPQPVIWSPAASGWGQIVNQRRQAAGKAPIVGDSTPFMVTPLVIAMPKPMADALGYPATPVGFTDIVKLAENPAGWAAYGHPEWGPFRLGKTNPNFSTSGLNFTIAEYYAATGKTQGLTSEDLARPEVVAFAQGVENSVVHYGDTTLTFLNNWYRADARGTALTYASAVAVEEKSVLDYNAGNPDGVLDAGEVARPPRVPLVAIYPSEGTLYSDNPFYILDAPWVDADQREAATRFTDFVTQPENQAKVLEFNFRPGNPAVPVGAPVEAANGVDPSQPQTLLEVPRPDVMVAILDAWNRQRKAARVMLLIDVSGSMGDQAAAGSSETKLDLAKAAAVRSLDRFGPNDEVGLRIFSTDVTSDPNVTYVDVVPVGPLSANADSLRSAIEGLVPVRGTPLYAATQASYESMLSAFDPAKINAIVLLSDGVNDDAQPSDDAQQLDALIAALEAGSEGAASRPVRVFPIAYGQEADLATLRRIAEATNAAVYSSTDPTTIDQVFTAVVSNF